MVLYFNVHTIEIIESLLLLYRFSYNSDKNLLRHTVKYVYYGKYNHGVFCMMVPVNIRTQFFESHVRKWSPEDRLFFIHSHAF